MTVTEQEQLPQQRVQKQEAEVSQLLVELKVLLKQKEHLLRQEQLYEVLLRQMEQLLQAQLQRQEQLRLRLSDTVQMQEAGTRETRECWQRVMGFKAENGYWEL